MVYGVRERAEDVLVHVHCTRVATQTLQAICEREQQALRVTRPDQLHPDGHPSRRETHRHVHGRQSWQTEKHL